MRKNSEKKNNNVIKSIRLVLYCLTIQVCILSALCIFYLIADINTVLVYPFTVIGLCAGNMLSGYISGRVIRQNGLINGVIYTLPSTIVILFLSLYLNDFSIGFKMPLSAVLLCVFAASGGILSVNIKKRAKLKR